MAIRNKLLIILSCVFMLICLTFVGCKSNEEKTAYISASDNVIVIEQTYMVGEDIKLNGQKIDYFEDIKNSVPTEKEIVVTKNMISGFSTKTAGEYTLKIQYKNAISISVNYNVYNVPNIEVYNGTYTSAMLGQNTLIEVSNNKATIKFYEKGYFDYTNSNPTKTTNVDLTVGVLKGGKAKLCFVYEGFEYSLTNFDENGKPQTVLKVDKSEEGISSISGTCSLLENIIAPKIGETYSGKIESSDSMYDGQNLAILILSDSISISAKSANKETRWIVNDNIISISSKIVINCKTSDFSSLIIRTISENEIVVSLKDNQGNTLFSAIHCFLETA